MGNIRPLYRGQELVSYEAFAGKLNGRKIRKRFPVAAWLGPEKARKAAERWLKSKTEQINTQRAYGAILDERILSQVSEALELLQPLGISLIEAVRAFVRERTEEEKPPEAWKVSEAVTELLRNRKAKGVSIDYLKDLRFSLDAFCEDFGDMALHEITVELLEDWLDEREGRDGGELSPISRSNWRRDLSMIWRFSIQRDRARENPAALLPRAIDRDGEIHILQVDEAETLFSALRKRQDAVAQETRVFAALACFCGLRSIEIHRLNWSNIKLDQGIIEVPARVSKTRARRTVRIATSIVTILSQFKIDEGPVITISPRVIRRCLASCSQVPLLPNVFRHSWFSYHLALYQNENLTQLQGGHSSSDVLYRHYRAIVTDQAANQYFSILP